MADAVILAIDNGGTNTRVAMGGQRIERIETYSTPQGYDEAIKRLAAAANSSNVKGSSR